MPYRVTGFTSTLPSPFSLFFWEYDETALEDVLEDANLLTQIFDFELYIMESSPRNYHLISFDVLPLETVNRIQNWTTSDGDFLTVKESMLFDGYLKRQWNALRISEKGKKPKPRFIARLTRGNNLKSLKHFKVYQIYTGIPDPEPEQLKLYVPLSDVQITIYKTGVGAKPKPNPLGDRLLALKERERLKKSLKYLKRL